ncbi:hypothetical protein VTK73DRAFT_7091 [Phialemonium thermophilum]|uniref:Uncharacterized protein n=1 Tax=Phialemonium thermophilum TaxID=223376 RepID=A0ABR3XUL4_9PEZI
MVARTLLFLNSWERVLLRQTTLATVIGHLKLGPDFLRLERRHMTPRLRLGMVTMPLQQYALIAPYPLADAGTLQSRRFAKDHHTLVVLFENLNWSPCSQAYMMLVLHPINPSASEEGWGGKQGVLSLSSLSCQTSLSNRHQTRY